MRAKYNIRIYHKLSNIDQSQLSEIFALSESDGSDRNLEWLEIIEGTYTSKPIPYYFVVYQKEKIVGLCTATIVPEMEFTYKGFNNLDKTPANILKLNSLLCNFPLTNFHGYFFRNESHTGSFLKLFFKEMAENLKPDGIFLGPFNEKECEIYGKLIPEEFIKKPYYALAYMDVRFSSFDKYLSNLRSKIRWDVKNKIKKFEKSGVKIEYCYNSKPFADRLFTLYMNTVRNNPEFEMPFNLTPLFFEKISKYLGKRFEMILIKKGEKIMAFGFVIKKKDIIGLKFVGLDYDFSYKTASYFNIFFEVIRLAIKNNSKKICFGATSLYNKKRIGCKVIRPYVYMASYPLDVFKMFKKSGILKKKFIGEDFFTRNE